MIREIWGKSGPRPKLVGPDQNPCCTEWTAQFLSELHAGPEPAALSAFAYHNYDGHKADHAPGVLGRELPTAAFLDRHIEKGALFRELVPIE